MDNATFKKTLIIEQYKTLREEIRETKARIFKLVGVGVFVVPAVQYIAEIYDIEVIVLIMPILVIVLAVLYLSENHGLMRAGAYIKTRIEPYFENLEGWESWLESETEGTKRNPDKYLSYCFYLLYLVYFTAALVIVIDYVILEYPFWLSTTLLTLYSVAGVWMLVFLVTNVRLTTSTKQIIVNQKVTANEVNNSK